MLHAEFNYIDLQDEEYGPKRVVHRPEAPPWLCFIAIPVILTMMTCVSEDIQAERGPYTAAMGNKLLFREMNINPNNRSDMAEADQANSSSEGEEFRR